MKKLFQLTLLLLIALSSNYANASLIYSDHNVSNTSGAGLVYDSSQNLTWYQSGTITSQQTYSQALNFVNQVNAGTLDDIHGGWHLPTVTQMHNLYNEIDNGSQNRVGVYSFGSGANDFIFVAAANYWSFYNNGGIVDVFDFSTGYFTSELLQLGNKHNGWLVHDGSFLVTPPATVPLPPSIAMFASGVVGLIIARGKKRQVAA